MHYVSASPSLLSHLGRYVGSSVVIKARVPVRTMSQQIGVKLEPQNQLERNLVSALDGNPIERMAFYKTIVAPKTALYLVKPPPTLEGSPELRIKTFTLEDRVWVPAYSSLRQLRVANTNLPFLEVPALAFLQLAESQKKNIFLNARAPLSKELPHEELTAILDGSIMQPYMWEPEQTALTLGEPTEKPTWVIDTLRRVFEKKPGVKAAYLAVYNNPDSKFLVAVDVAEEWEALIEEVSAILKGHSVPGDAVDFICLSTGTDALRQFFDTYQPFYKAS